MLLGKVFLSEKQVIWLSVTPNIFTDRVSLQIKPAEEQCLDFFSLLILEFLRLKAHSSQKKKGLGLVSPYLGRQATGFQCEVNMGLECVYFISLRGQGQVL